MTKTFALIAALLLLGGMACAHELTVGDLQFIHPHIPRPAATAQVAGGYLAISNAGAQSDRLLGVSSTIAKSVSLHQSRVDANGVASMSPVEMLEIPAGDTVLLEPGGYHIMFMGLTGRFSEGDMLPVTLTFEKAGAIEMEFMVDPADGTAMEHDHDRAMPSE
jgi:copper(I)-binding protein